MHVITEVATNTIPGMASKSCPYKKLCVCYLASRVTEMTERENEIFHLLIHFPNACNQAKPRKQKLHPALAQKWQDLSTWAILCSFPGLIGRELDWMWSS